MLQIATNEEIMQGRPVQYMSFKQISDAAYNGSAEYQFLMGQIFEFGLAGFAVDKSRSMRWYGFSNSNGHIRANLKLHELEIGHY